jgi:AcrR family transcriptional regulator
MTQPLRKPRPPSVSKASSRSAILEAARRVAVRDGARDLSLRAVAAEAGFAPAGLYGYFRSKDDLLLALAADDLSGLARAMRDAGGGRY